MKPTSRSALGFAVACLVGVATSGCRVVRRTLRYTALLAVLCALGATSLCHAIEAQTIAINFASEKATLEATQDTNDVGFTKTLTEGGRTLNLGQKLSSKLWYASRGGSGSDITVKGALSADTTERTGLPVTLAFDANGIWNSSNDKTSGSLIGKLTHGYLDNGASSQSQNSITISNLPTTGYDVAVILSGDGYDTNGNANQEARKTKFSPIAVNGVDYTADVENGTYPGDACWGKRDSSTSLTEGVNVLFVRNVMTPTLTLRGYYLSKGRGTIAALMIFIHGTEGNETEQTVSATATAESTVFSGNGLTWTSEASERVTALGPNTTATLDLPSATRLALNSSVDLRSLALTGEGSLTFSTISKGGLSATSTSVGADLDVSAKEFGASLGAVTVAADKTLTLGEDTMVSGVTHSSATSKVVFQGTRALTSVPTWALQTTGSVEFNRPISTSGDVAVGLGNSAAVTRRIVFKKDVQASHFVTGNGSDTVTDITQEGGTLTFTASSADMTTNETTNPAIIFGHWPTTNRYELKAGKLLAMNGCAVLSWGNNNQGSNYTTTVNIGQSLDAAGETTAMMKVKGLTGHTRLNNVATLTVYPSGTLSVGEWGLTNGSSPNKNIILAGGTLNAYATTSTTLTNGLKVTAPSKVTAATGTTLTIDKINFTTAEEVTIGSVSEAGSVVIQTVTGETGSFNVAAGSLKVTEADSLGTSAVTVAEGATLELAIAGGETQMANPISGVGTIEKRGSGVVTLMAAAANTLNVSVLEGTLNIGALRPATLSIADGAQVIVVPTEEEVAAGSLSLPVGITAAKVIIQNYSIASISETGVVTFTDINVWTNATGDGQWSTEGNWSMGAPLPGDTATVKVMVDAQTTLTLPESGATVARLRVSGTDAAHTLTLSGGALTVNGSIVLAGANLTAGSETLPLTTVTAIDLGEGTALDYTVAGSAQVKLPALTGSGTFTKYGTGTESNALLFKDATTAYLAPIVVAEGVFSTGELQTDQEFHITVNEGATFLTKSTTSLTSTASTLCLKGGAILDLRNGTGTRQFQTAITVDALAETPAIIQGSRNGNNSNLQGAITGKGTLEIRNAPDQTDANAFTISGNISNAADGILALKVTQTGTEAAVTLTGNNNTYTGGTTIADRAKVIVETIGKLGPSGTVQVEDGGKLKLVNSSNLNEEGTDYSRVTGTGTVWYSGSNWRTLPNTAEKRLPTSISVQNDLTAGLIISQWNNDTSPETAVGSVSGSGTFRVDWSGDNNSRSLRIVQSKNTEHTGNFIYDSFTARLTKVIVAGAAGATNKTLTLSGNTTTTARPLEIESSGSVKLTGLWNATITINGALEVPVESGTKTISTDLAGTTGTLTKSGAGQLNLTGTNNTFSGKVAITGGILNVGSNRGFTVSAIESDAKLALSPTESEIAAGQIDLRMANGVTLSAEQLSVTGYPGVTGAGGYIYLPNPCWKPTAEDATWENNWYRGTTAMATAPTSGKIEVNFSARTTETEVTIPEGAFDAVTFVGGEAEGCSLVVTLGEEVSLGALTVRGRVTLPDTAIPAATEITAGATLSLAGSGATISTAITGAGSLCQRSGSTSLTGKNTYTGTTTVEAGATLSLAREREEEWVLSDAFGDGSAVIVHGTLELAKGSYCRRTTGEGIIRVLDEQTFAIGQAALPNGEAWSDEMTTGLTGFTGTLALVGNFELRNAGPAEYTYAPKGFNVRFEDNGQGSSDGELVSASETNPVQVVLADKCTLSGKGFVKCPIAFEANSVIEVTTATRLDLSEATITLPSGEGEHILLNAAVASNGFLYVAPSANVPASAFAFAEESAVKADTAAITVYRSSTEDTVQVITNPPVPTGTPTGVAAAIRDQAKHNGMPVTVQAVTTDKTKPKVKLEGALFFENVVKTEIDSDTYQVTAKVTYDFGVSAIKVKKLTLAGTGTEQLCVVVCAKVESSAITGTPAIFKDSAQVQLYLNDVFCDSAVKLTNAIDSTVDASDQSERWFAVPLGSLPTTGTSNFTVKVTEATP